MKVNYPFKSLSFLAPLRKVCRHFKFVDTLKSLVYEKLVKPNGESQCSMTACMVTQLYQVHGLTLFFAASTRTS